LVIRLFLPQIIFFKSSGLLVLLLESRLSLVWVAAADLGLNLVSDIRPSFGIDGIVIIWLIL
jgi:hypothetical protein